MFGRIVLPAVLLLSTIVAGQPAGAATGQPGPVDRPVRTTGCGKTPPSPAGTPATRTVVSGGVTRTYLLHVPPGYHRWRPTPVVLSFHGRTRTSEYQQEFTRMNQLDAIVAYPRARSATTASPRSRARPTRPGFFLRHRLPDAR